MFKAFSIKTLGSTTGFLLGLFLGLVSVPEGALATSGACSSHDGVSCASGPDLDGSVICNDGWMESTVNYYQSDECSDYLCPEQQVIYDELYASADWSLGIANICEELGWTDYGYLDACLEIRQDEIEYQWSSLWETVDSYRYLCYDDFDADYYNNSCQITYGEHSYGDSEFCYCEDGYSFDEEEQCILEDSNESSEDNPEETAVQEEEIVGLVDIADHWAQNEIETMVEYGVVEGNPDGTFNPDGNLNRAEAAALLWRVLSSGDPDDPPESPFTDVSLGEWYTSYIAVLKDFGLISGNPDGTYEPSENINRAEFLQLATNVYLYLYPEKESVADNIMDGTTTDDYADLDISAWYAGVVTVAAEWEFITGSDCEEGKCFNAGNYITRAEATKVLYNMFLDILAYEGMSLTVDMDSDGYMGLTGTTTLTQSGGRTWVEIVLTNYSEGMEYPAQIRVGGCEDPGSVTYTLEDVEEGYSGTELQVSLAGLLDMLPLHIGVYEVVGSTDFTESCGDL